MSVIDLQGKHAIVEVILNIIPDFAKEVSLSRMNLTNKYSVNILSIKRNDRFVKVSKDTMFRKGDVVVVYGLINDIKDAFVNSISIEKEPVATDKSNEISLVNNYGNIAIVEVYVEDVPAELDNVRLEDAKLKDRYDITIGFIERNDVYLTVTKDTIIQKGDTVTLFGPYRNIKILFKNDDNEQK